METLAEFFRGQVIPSVPYIRINDVVEVIIMAFLIYQLILWIKNTRAWTLLKGICILAAFYAAAVLFQLNTIVYLVGRSLNVVIIAVVVIFQPELRRALEQLGRKNMLSGVFSLDSARESDAFTEQTANEIVRASCELGKARTGALIVIENKMALTEYEQTGIGLDAVLTSQLLINIFEHNTPLHDGAVVVRGNRVTSATCYLPLSDNMLISKDLGTRHRAGIGISEVTDSLTVIVSEETGYVSLAREGRLIHGVGPDVLKAQLMTLCGETPERRPFKLWKGRGRNEKTSDQ